MADIETDSENTTLMWAGWNSNLIPRDDETHKIWYLPQINMSTHPMQSLLKHWKNHRYNSRMWETMHCCNIWFGNRQNGIPNSIRRETKVWQHLYSTWSISNWNSTVSLLPSIYCIIWWTSQTKRMSCSCQMIYQIISTRQK